MLFEDGTRMRKTKASKLGSLGLGVALLLVVLLAGCGDPDANCCSGKKSPVSNE